MSTTESGCIFKSCTFNKDKNCAYEAIFNSWPLLDDDPNLFSTLSKLNCDGCANKEQAEKVLQEQKSKARRLNTTNPLDPNQLEEIAARTPRILKNR